MIRPLRTQPRNDYPTSDGKPMAETELHRNLMVDILQTLQWWFRDRPDVCVTGDLLVFYEKGDRRRHVAPDVFVVPGVGNHLRENYLLWEEGGGLDLVIEVTSSSTRREDTGRKSRLYAEKLAVREYVLFDPREEYLEPSFQAYRRSGEVFRPARLVDGRFTSKVLGLGLERDGTQLRFRDPTTGERLPTPAERLATEASRAEAEAARADAAEAELARLKSELARLRGGRNGS
jgi:Uma2 family endonuclease